MDTRFRAVLKGLAAFSVVLAAGAGCSKGAQRAKLPPEQAQRLLLDRNWIDRLPETPRDRLHVFRFVPSMGGGVYQDRTLFAGQFELFTFDHDGDRIAFHLHHTGEEPRVDYTIERMPGGSDEPLDLHLHLSDSPRGPSDYYSIRDMNGAGTGDAKGLPARLDEGLRALFPGQSQSQIQAQPAGTATR